MFTYTLMPMSELIEKVRILKPELTDKEVLAYLINMNYVLDNTDPFVI